MKSPLIKTVREKHVLTLFLNREHSLNALDTEMLLALEKTLNAVEKDENIRVCLLTGAGKKAFSAGADVNEEKKKNPVQMLQFCRMGQRVCRYIESLQKPVIAVINGYALGGGLELALACDFRVASSHAKLGFPEINLGVTTGWGGCSRLIKTVGPSRARELIFFGQMIDAKEAHAMGLVDHVFPPEKLLPEAKKMAEILSKKPPIALGLYKLMINRSSDSDSSAGEILELMGSSLCYSTEDQKEGFEAFLRKVKPRFRGK